MKSSQPFESKLSPEEESHNLFSVGKAQLENIRFELDGVKKRVGKSHMENIRDELDGIQARIESTIQQFERLIEKNKQNR